MASFTALSYQKYLGSKKLIMNKLKRNQIIPNNPENQIFSQVGGFLPVLFFSDGAKRSNEEKMADWINR